MVNPSEHQAYSLKSDEEVKPIESRIVGEFSCPKCDYVAKTTQGLKLHMTKNHAKFERKIKGEKKMKEKVEILYNKVKSTNIVTLRNMYSPMFDKNFSELNDGEIKLQLDLWLENGEHKQLFNGTKKETQENRKFKFNNFVKNKRR